MIQPCTASSEMYSDVTGDKIKTGEPILRFHDCYLKLRESKEVKRKLKTKYKKGYIKDKLIKKEECLKCFESKKEVRNVLETKICKDCISDLIEEIEKQKRELEEVTIYWNHNGINIRRNNIYDKYYYDDIDGNKIEDDVLITLASDDNTFFTKLGNIGRLVNELNSSDNLLENFRHKKKMKVNSCSSCSSKRKLKLMGELALCPDCREKRRNILEKYLRENREKIIANEI